MPVVLLEILKRFWKEILLGSLVGVLLFVIAIMGFKIYSSGQEIDLMKARHKIEIEMIQKESLQTAIEDHQKTIQEIKNVVKQSEERQKSIVADYNGAINAYDSLSDTLEKNNANLINASSEARVDYTNSIQDLFKESTGRYLELAKTCDGHINDLKTIREAWDKR